MRCINCKFSPFTGCTRVHAPCCTLERVQALDTPNELPEPQFTQQSLPLLLGGHREDMIQYLKNPYCIVLIYTLWCSICLS